MERPFALDASGWSILPDTAEGDRTIYVDPAGNDSNDGYSEEAPKLTWAGGWALVRDGFADRILLKRGGSWSVSSTTLRNGRSASERLVIGAYGTGDRPILDVGNSVAFATTFGGTTRYIAIVGIRVIHTGRAGDSSCGFISATGAGDAEILVEGCYSDEPSVGYNFTHTTGPQSNIALRRNICYRAHSTNVSNGGLGYFCNNVAGLWLEENIATHCGWKAGVVDPIDGRHGFYLQSTCTDVAAYRNVAVKSSALGMHFRCQGVCENNLFIEGRVGLQLGGGTSPVSGGAVVTARYNVVIEANPAGTPAFAIGLQAYNLRDSVIRYNLVCNRTTGTGPVGMIIDGTQQGAIMQRVQIEDNIVHDWDGPVRVLGSDTQLEDTTFRRNQIESNDTANNLMVYTSLAGAQAVTHANNRLLRNGGSASHFTGTNFSPNPCTFAQYASQIGDATSTNNANTYSDPTRTVVRYLDEEIGQEAPTHDTYIDALNAQVQGAWEDSLMPGVVNAWMRAGFGLPNPASSAGNRPGINTANLVAAIVAAKVASISN